MRSCLISRCQLVVVHIYQTHEQTHFLCSLFGSLVSKCQLVAVYFYIVLLSNTLSLFSLWYRMLVEKMLQSWRMQHGMGKHHCARGLLRLLADNWDLFGSTLFFCKVCPKCKGALLTRLVQLVSLSIFGYRTNIWVSLARRTWQYG